MTNISSPREDLQAAHQAWLQNPEPTKRDAAAYERQLRSRRNQQGSGEPPNLEPQIHTPQHLRAWCLHQKDVLNEAQADTDMSQLASIVGRVRVAWQRVRSPVAKHCAPGDAEVPHDRAQAVAYLDRVINGCSDVLQQSPNRTLPGGAPSVPPSSGVPPVVLNGQAKAPVVKGKPKPTLRHAQYNVVQALLRAGGGGLTKDQLVSQSGHSDAVNILKRLARDRDWATVIGLPGTSGKRYRIL